MDRALALGARTAFGTPWKHDCFQGVLSFLLGYRRVGGSQSWLLEFHSPFKKKDYFLKVSESPSDKSRVIPKEATPPAQPEAVQYPHDA